MQTDARALPFSTERFDDFPLAIHDTAWPTIKIVRQASDYKTLNGTSQPPYVKVARPSGKVYNDSA